MRPRKPAAAAIPVAVDVTALAHASMGAALERGAIALDATAGNGGDTLYLAAAVGPQGRVHAFDIQAAALERARERLHTAGIVAGVHWHLCCHSGIDRYLPPGSVAAAMFNLGWLPGGLRRVMTRPATTIAALSACAGLMAPAGRISIVCYRGHDGGAQEEEAVARWVAAGSAGLRLLLECPASNSPRAPVLRVLEAA